MYIFHNSQEANYRKPFGAVACGTEVDLAVAISDCIPEKVDLHIWREGVGSRKFAMKERTVTANCFEYEYKIKVPPTPGIYWYCFEVSANGQTMFYGNNADRLGGIGEMCDSYPAPFQITAFDKKFTTPDWMKTGIMYQIFPDRFARGEQSGQFADPKPMSLLHLNWADEPIYARDPETQAVVAYDFFGGNIQGIIDRLPYLKGLGVTVLYLNPIFEAESNHRYDTGDYKKIDQYLGDEQAFRLLCSEAEHLGINVILDGVFSHTGNNSVYFNSKNKYASIGAAQSTKSEYCDWYSFKKDGSYDCWWGIDNMPNVNELTPTYLDYILRDKDSVIKKWLRAGAKGWRLDVADELPDEFIKELRKAVKEVDKDAVVIGEVWEDASNKKAYDKLREYLIGDELDAPMNYPLRKVMLDFALGNMDATRVSRELMSLCENYPPQVFAANMNLLGTHDRARVLTVLGKGHEGEGISFADKYYHSELNAQERKTAVSRLKMLSLWQMCHPGIPSVYYGDEAGMQGFADPLNRRAYPWGKEDKEIYEWFKLITALRVEYPVLQTGEWRPLYANADCFVFSRHDLKNTAIVAVNRSSQLVSVTVDSLNVEKYYDILDGHRTEQAHSGQLNLSLAPQSTRLLVQHVTPKREAGILMHPTSFPSRFGIGDFGKEAYTFIDFMERSGQKLWQLLPINPVGYGESPYQGLSAFAGNPLMISPDLLVESKLLTEKDVQEALADKKFTQDKVDFEPIKKMKDALFRKAFAHAKNKVGKTKEYKQFVTAESEWLEDWALFAAIKAQQNMKPWTEWPEELVKREENALVAKREELADEIEYQRFLQFIYFRQWFKLKKYANAKNIKIVGDIPIFVAHDSSDVWAMQHLFELNYDGSPSLIAGVPPDYFSATGQRWGNPHYKWQLMEQDDFAWWRLRVGKLAKIVDILRIDHFRGFEAYWEIAATEPTAIIGQWVKGPDRKLFDAIEKHLGKMNIIAENLGVITPPVEYLRERFGYPGMIIVQFAVEGERRAPFDPNCYLINEIVYTGTHDNDTTTGFFDRIKTEKPDAYKNIVTALGFDAAKKIASSDICERMIELTLSATANTAIVPMQDWLGLDNSARMNVPSTLGGNWEWRMLPEALDDKLAARITKLTEKHGRN